MAEPVLDGACGPDAAALAPTIQAPVTTGLRYIQQEAVAVKLLMAYLNADRQRRSAWNAIRTSGTAVTVLTASSSRVAPPAMK